VPSALEFQDVDLVDARKSLEELPAGVTERHDRDADYWRQRRRKPVPTDRALTGAAIDWLVSMPQEFRPKALGEQFPRIANRLAEIWRDRARTLRELEHLRDDGRRGRGGFSVAIDTEIRLLIEHIKVQSRRQP